MRLFAVLIALSLGACASTGSIDYVPTAVAVPGPPAAISAVAVVDSRDEKPNRIATIRGGYGNPVYVLDLDKPVADAVSAIVSKALLARGMLSPPGVAPYRMQIVIRALYGNQYLSQNAYVDMDLLVYDRSGQTVYQDTIKDHAEEGAFFKSGAFADINELGKFVQTLLNTAVDRLLDKPALRAVLRAASAAGRPAA